MPLTRYQIRNEYGLADPELYRAADRDDPEALLEGVAMAGLVGVLRQLGDLAEFAAEIFHDLHEEVMATATRGHSLMIRVHQLEADFPTIEKALLSQTNHSSFFSNAGVDWHPNLRSEQNLITCGDMPRFVMDSYEECRGPPRLFLLDKFDVAGAGACLKRYTDPSFFKAESASSGIATVEMRREKKIRKVKKKGSRWRNGDTPDVSLTSHAKLHELFLEERIANGYSDSTRLVKLKKRHLNASAVDSKTGKSYMEKFLETPSPERKLVCETSVTPPPLKLTSDNTSESGLRMLDISIVSPAEKSPESRSSRSSPNAQEVILKPSVDGFNGGVFDGEIAKVSELDSDGETDKSYSNLSMVAVEKQLAVDGEDKNEGSLEGYNSDDVTGEVDNYVDALPTMESEMETDNENRPKNNLPFLNFGKYGSDSNPSEEEHMELQEQFLDSQSIGNSSTSDDINNSYKKDGASFLHSDTLSNLVENTPSDCNGEAKEFPSTETCGAEIFGMPSNQPSVIVESLEATSNEHVVSHDKCIEEDLIPDTGDTSCSTFVGEMSPTHSDSGARSQEVSLMGPVLDETPCGKIKVGSESSDINENRTNMDDSMADVPDDSYQTKDEFTNTSAIHPVDESDVQELGVISDALVHLSNVSELASEDQSGNNSVNEVFQAQCADEDSMESLASRKIDSPRLSVSPTEEQLFSSALPEVQTYSGDTSLPYYSDVANPDTMVSKPDDSVAPTAVNSEVIPLVVDTAWSHCSEDLYPVVDAPQTCGLIEMQDAPQTHGLMEQEFSDLNEDVPQLESISAEVGIPHYEGKLSVEEISRTVDDEEIGLFTSDVDAEGGDAVELPSYCPTYPGYEDHVNSDVVPGTVHVESVAVSSAAVSKTDDDVNDVSPDTIPSPSRNFEILHESLSNVGDLNQKESELDDVVSPECVIDSETQKEVSKLEVVSPDSESNPKNSVTYDHSRSEVSDDGHDFSLDEQTEKSLTVCDVTTASTSLILSNHESESQSLDQCHTEDVASSSTCYIPEPETSLENLLELQVDQVDTEYLQRDGASDQPEPALERPLEFKSDQLDAECSQEDKASINSSNLQSSNLQSAQIGSANHMDKETSKQLPSTEHINQEICLDTFSGSCPENLRSQPSTSELLPESEGQELDVMKQTMEPLESIHPSFVLLPEAAVVNLEDMPPLPPLPPMQWRMGKIQHGSLASQGEFFGVSQDGFLPIGPIQPSKADEKAQFDVPAPQGGILQPQNPFLPLTSVEDAKSEHVSEPLGGNVVQPASYSLQLTTMVNDANYQYSCPDLGAMQFSNPFLSLSEVSDDRSGHNDLALEGDKAQSCSNPFSVPANECTTSNQDPVFSHGAIIQPVQQLTPETGLEPKVLKHSLENSEWEQGKPLTTSVTAPIMVDEQPQHSLPTLEREIAWSSNTSAVMADSDVGRSNGNPVSKLPRPRNPLIDAVAAHGQSKLRKVTERDRPQIEPKVDERDSLLEQIRAKSFNLKPATVTRPNIQGPKTNLKVAAILAKANAIRQAFAGSDEDDDGDSWSDS